MNKFVQQMPVPPVGQCLQHGDCMKISEKPDALSDGSASHPKLPHYGLATAAVWWPGRSLQAMPLTQLEREYGHVREHSDGISVAAHLQGYDPSFTRAELLRVVLALFSPAC